MLDDCQRRDIFWRTIMVHFTDRLLSGTNLERTVCRVHFRV